MKLLTGTILSASLLLIGCGGDSNEKTSAPQTNNMAPANTVKEATRNLNALSSFQSIDISKAIKTNKSTQKMYKVQKGETVACPDGGSLNYDISDNQKEITYKYKSCQNGAAYINGNMTIDMDNQENYTVVISDFTYRDVGGEQYMDLTMKQTYKNQIKTIFMNGQINQKSSAGEINNIKMSNMTIAEKEVSSDSWSTINGGLDIVSKCFSGKYNFKTIEKLVDAQDGTDNIESGILELNDATYTFENPYVTIKAINEEKTMLQSKFEKEIENSASTCKK